MTTQTLQDRRAALGRDAILDALVAHLEAGDADEVSMEDLAREAGVSRRTLYRYFPTRADLIAAAGEHVRGRVLNIESAIAPTGLAATFRAGVARSAARPRLARALLATESGRAVRGTFRGARVEAIRREVKALAPHLGKRVVERAAALLTYLCSLNAWISLQDESGLSPERAEEAVLWAIELIQTELKREPRKDASR
ncbi:MAG TPA: helix-turn-helix domain-containing protein [Pseudolabrys sp.]|nr:helix-turn-helix domain-containing protein [Pseudolabrys sp.]